MKNPANKFVTLALIIGSIVVATSHVDAASSNKKLVEQRAQRRIQNPKIASSSSSKKAIQPSTPWQPSSAQAEAAETMKIFCSTHQEWTCSDWGACDKNGRQTRNCVRDPKVTSFCKKGKNPGMSQACAVDQNSRMKENLNKWDAIHKEMIDAAKGMTQQGEAGKQGLHRLNQIESSFILRYNEYVQIYNDPKMKGIAITQIEESMAKIIDEFKSLPTIWY